VTAKDILLVVIIPLALAEFGPWCGWLAARVLPLAAKLRYGDTYYSCCFTLSARVLPFP